MSARMRERGVSLRPHLKTAKSADVARLAVDGEAGGITVSTIAEAEYFADHGLRDITLAVGITPEKLDRITVLSDHGATITVITDDVIAARAIAAHHGEFKVLIEIDSGESRGGVAPDSEALIEMGKALGPRLAGVLTHAGHSYEARGEAALKKVAEDERVAVTTAAQRLRDAGMQCDVVSLGSTPSMSHVEKLDGVTEARPGVYMFQDLFQAAIGSCTRDDIVVTVLASVIGCRPSKNQILIDAGAIAMSKDRSTATTDQDAGFGLVWDIDGKESLGALRVDQVFQEHGIVTSSAPLPFDKLAVGTKVRVAPNHSCLTAAAYEKYYVVDGGQEIVAEWERVNGW